MFAVSEMGKMEAVELIQIWLQSAVYASSWVAVKSV